MNPLSNATWSFIKHKDDTSMMLGTITAWVPDGCQVRGYHFAVSKDYALMRQKNDYFWYVLEYMSRELAECLM